MTNPNHTDTSRSDDLVERLRGDWPEILVEKHWMMDSDAIDKQREEAADRIEELETQNEGYKLALAEQLQIRQELEAWKAAEEAHHHMLRQELDRCRASNTVMDNTVASLTAEVERLREALGLADAALRGANMNMNVVERKLRAALKEIEAGEPFK